jgi:hypothetical protein
LIHQYEVICEVNALKKKRISDAGNAQTTDFLFHCRQNNNQRMCLTSCYCAALNRKNVKRAISYREKKRELDNVREKENMRVSERMRKC